MTSRWTMVFLCVFVALTTAYWWTGRPTDDELRPDDGAGPVFAIGADQITGLSIRNAEGQTIDAIRVPETGEWTLQGAHAAVPANHAAWERLAGAVASVRNARSIESDFEASGIYGLDSPEISVTVSTQNSIEQLDIGGIEPTQTFRYARLASEGIFLTPAATFDQLNKELADLRDRQVFHLGGKPPVRIEYEAKANSVRPEPFAITIERSGDQWSIVEPVHEAASPIHAGRLAEKLQSLKGRNYIDNPTTLADYGLARPFANVTVFSEADDQGETLLLGWLDDSDESGGLFAKYPGELGVFVIDADLVTLLPEDVAGMRERRLLTREASELVALSYSGPSTDFRLEIDDNGAWKLVKPEAPDTDPLAVSAYIAVLKRIEALDFPDPGSADRGNARLSLTFEFEDGATRNVAIGAPIPDTDPVEFYAWQADGTLVALPLQAVVLLQADPFHFRDRRLLRFDPKSATAIELSFESENYTFRRDGERWTVAEPAGLRFESQDDARALLEALAESKADVLITTEPEDEQSQLDDPVLRAVVTHKEDDNARPQHTQTLLVGALSAAESRQRFVRHESGNETYLTDQALIDDVRAALEGVVPR